MIWLAVALAVALAGHVALFWLVRRDDARGAARIVALRSVTPVTWVPTPVDAGRRDEFGRPY